MMGQWSIVLGHVLFAVNRDDGAQGHEHVHSGRLGEVLGLHGHALGRKQPIGTQHTRQVVRLLRLKP